MENANLSDVERESISTQIESRYRKVAQNPRGIFKYPTGREGMKALGYDPATLALLPDEVAESYCGVGNPFSLGALKPGERALDIGCGAGVDTLIAALMTAPDGFTAGVDVTRAMIERARHNATLMRVSIDFQVCGAESLPYKDNWFDLVISNGALNLVAGKASAAREMFRVLRPGGGLQVADQILINETPREMAVMVKNWGH
ncbi:MAG: methyltransferase domain-containing protein [Nitrospinae bacterium]|nr:methyltransferase domain-containing protein [Nitrospinota bacterium]